MYKIENPKWYKNTYENMHILMSITFDPYQFYI